MDYGIRHSGLIVPERYGQVTDLEDMECIQCGCSQYDACYEGEPWAEPYLCESCASFTS